MGNAQSRREAREAQRKKNNRTWAALGGAGIVLLSGGILAYSLSSPDSHTANPQAIPSSCTTTQRVTVATTDAMAKVLEQIPVDPDDCITLAVSHNSSANDVATQIIKGKSAPNLWIPDSSTRAELALAGKADMVTKSDSLAKSPAVIVSSEETNYPTWNKVLADNANVAMGDPRADSGAFASLMNASVEVSDGETKPNELTSATGLRAQTIGVDSPAQTAQEGMRSVEEGKIASTIATEADFVRYKQDNPDSQLTAQVPDSGTTELNYPMYQPTVGSGTNHTIAQAADKISSFVASQEGKDALEQVGLRTSEGNELADSPAVKVKTLNETDPSVVSSTWRSYLIQSAPLNALVAIDSSSSMGWELGNEGKTRMDVTLESVLAGAQLFPARDSLGVWSFAYDIGEEDGQKTDYREIVPIRNLETDINGTTQRDLILEKAQAIKPYPDSLTGLNDTLLAAFREVKENYETDSTNTVVVLTDGENTDQPDYPTDELIDAIQREQDPENPVYFVLIGISQDANMQALEALAPQIGGEAYSASSAEDIQKIFQQALSVSPDEAKS